MDHQNYINQMKEVNPGVLQQPTNQGMQGQKGQMGQQPQYSQYQNPNMQQQYNVQQPQYNQYQPNQPQYQNNMNM